MRRSHSSSSRCIRQATHTLEPLEGRQLFNGGSVDTTFGSNGFTRPFGFMPEAIAIQADGKSVVAGNLNNQFAVGRIDANGQVDTTFGPNHSGVDAGIAATSINGQKVYVKKVAVQSDGKIIVAGSIGRGNDYQYALVRFNANGSLDTSFGIKGVAYILPYNDEAWIGGLTVQPNGKILFTASRDNGTILDDSDIIVARLLPNGSLDNTFGDSLGSIRRGYVTTDFNSRGDTPTGIALMSNGQIVVGGDAGGGGQQGWVFARYNPNGTLDKTFDHDGIVGTDFPSFNYQGSLDAFAVEPDGEIYAAGIVAQSREFVAHYLPSGAFDIHFGNGGVFPGSAANYTPPVAVFLPAPGKILIVNSTGGGVQAVQYASSGALDPSFGVKGVATVSAAGTAGVNSNNLFYAIGAVENGHGQFVVAAWSGSADPSTSFTRIVEETPTVTVSSSQTIVGARIEETITVKRDQAYDFDTKVTINTTLTNAGHAAMAAVASPAGATAAGELVVDIPAGQTQVVLHLAEPIIQPIPVAKGTFSEA
ncbi:MAG TPA: hypothetical protein VFE47_04395 [Tepidisphaeraceae bacterium]|jgi:uncharacterized delta-60 repeat protein|nr:hypothetical protein [Tepidisphaeraceae bacterium]